MDFEAKYQVGDRIIINKTKVKGKIKEVDPIISMSGMIYRYYIAIPKSKSDWYWESELIKNV